MLDQKEIKILSNIFKDYDYVMTTAQLSSVKLYYRDIQRMLNEGLLRKLNEGTTIGQNAMEKLRL